MSLLLQSFRRLYSLETLDLRFTTPSKTPIAEPSKPHLNQDDRTKVASLPAGTTPSLWETKEFRFYYIFIAGCLVLMLKTISDISQPSHANYANYEDLLEPGWVPGRKVDNSDSQYSTFRENVPYMLALTVFHPLLRKLYNTICPVKEGETGANTGGQSSGRDLADARLDQRVTYDLYFAFVFLAALHGSSALKVLLILYTNYLVATKLPRNYVVPATWIFNIGILFANELCGGYPYQSIAGLVLPMGDSKSNWGTVLDSYGGLIPRWEILFNITVLRLISFNMDHYWSLDRSASSSLEKKQLDPSALSVRDRVVVPAKPEDYSFRSYFAYAAYAPLYLAGPIVTFNDYIAQGRYQSKSITTTRTLLYGIRFVICLLTMELVLHYTYAVAISKAPAAWEIYTPFQLSMLGYFNLHIIWLKLLLPWRFFRLWALVDGIDPPENMVRCMSDNYSALAFWRNWHRSFNQWLIRYIYIPMGGSGGRGHENFSKVRVVGNYITIFTFVALWHDINLRLLIWGWLIVLFILPEVLGTVAFPAKKWRDRRTAYRIICGIGAVGNILMMMAANLVGFALGLDGLQGLVHGIVGSYSGLVFIVIACSALFCASQVMFEIREHERRHNIKMNC